jgi:putative ABC transport system permease protein
LISGRNFSGNPGEAEDAYLVNEEFVKQYGWENPIGKTIARNGKHNVIGVVSNFNYSTAYEKIAPLIITNNPESEKFYYLSLKATPDGIARTIEGMKDIFQTKNSGIVPGYFFIDEAVGLLYKDELNFRTLFLFFSSLSIFLALMGLLGMVSFSLTQKKKEIGIRKVLGSSVTDIILLIYKEYFLLVFIAFVMAYLPTLYFMNRWLEDFAYRIDISIWLFAVSGAIVLIITLLTISSQAIKAAFTNPTESLRSE